MARGPQDIDAAVLSRELGAERWRTVQRAAWRGTPLEDGVLAAAAAITARTGQRAYGWATLAFAALLAGSAVGALGSVSALRLAVLGFAALATAVNLVGFLLHRRATRIHDARADYERLAASVRTPPRG